jgi:hypothetical protein
MTTVDKKCPYVLGRGYFALRRAGRLLCHEFPRTGETNADEHR